MNGLKLQLAMERTEAVRGESVRFVVTLTNTGATPATVPSLEATNHVLHLRALAADGKEFLGEEDHYDHMEGSDPPHIREKPRITLAPGQSVQVRGDVLTWIGELPVGVYTVSALFGEGIKFQVVSPPSKLTVVEPKPVFLGVQQPVAARDRAERLFPWVNESKQGFELFLLATSARNPTVSLYNRRLGPVGVNGGMLAGASHLIPPSPAHVVWAAGGKLSVARLTIEGPPEPIREVALPDEALTPLAPPFTNADGELAVVLAEPEGTTAGLLRLGQTGPPRYTPLAPRPPIERPCGVAWSTDGAFALVWTDEESRNVHMISGRVEAQASALTPRTVYTAPQEMDDLRPFMLYEEERATYAFAAMILSRDRTQDIWHRQLVRLEGEARVIQEHKRPIVHTGKSVGGPRVVQSELRFRFDDLPAAYYLIADSDGATYVLGPDLGQAAPVEQYPGTPVKRPNFPCLVASAASSKTPGMFVRYLFQGRMETRRVAD